MSRALPVRRGEVEEDDAEANTSGGDGAQQHAGDVNRNVEEPATPTQQILSESNKASGSSDDTSLDGNSFINNVQNINEADLAKYLGQEA